MHALTQTLLTTFDAGTNERDITMRLTMTLKWRDYSIEAATLDDEGVRLQDGENQQDKLDFVQTRVSVEEEAYYCSEEETQPSHPLPLRLLLNLLEQGRFVHSIDVRGRRCRAAADKRRRGGRTARGEIAELGQGVGSRIRVRILKIVS
jgi:hypothetical protein